ncbi:MAG TPA: ABC transporter permease [Methylomirabilota bacterium]|jgi:putative spermidine/putrescine transport system permease protein|nr:ABC transporter permease [Methylomirabilota bacterium]
MRRRFTGATAAKALSVAVYVFLLAPLLVVVLASFNSADFLSFPPRGFSLRWYRALWESEVWGDSFRLSLLLTAVVTPLALIIGTLAAYALVRYSFPGKGAMATLVMAPLVMPQIVLGIALLNYMSGLGLVGSLTGLILGHLVVTLPFTVRLVSISVHNLDPALERAAQNLGATPLQTFWRVTLPLLRPGIVAGAIFAAIISFGELAVTLLIAGARTTTLPLRIFNYTEYNFDPTINAVSTIFVVLALVLIIVLDRLIGLVRIG